MFLEVNAFLISIEALTNKGNYNKIKKK